MLRLLVVLLLVANGAFYGWTQGWFDQLVGVRAQGDREPNRMTLQVEPQRVRVVTASSPRPTEAAPSTPEATAAACLEIGPFTTAQLGAAETVLQTALPQTHFDDVKRETPAVWIVFMGPFADADARRKKSDELKRLKVTFEDIRRVPELGDGLALGRFDTRNAAEKAVTDLQAKGVRTARVAQFVAPVAAHTLRLPEVTTAQQTQLAGLQSPGLAGKSFIACTR
jgi:hypothetical protein